MSDSMRWYVVHTYSGYENKVATNIEKAVENRKFHDLIGEVKVPTETVTEIKDNKKRDVERKIFPGYVLVKMIMTDESWYIVRNIRGVTGFVGPGSKPVPLTEEEVARLGVEVRNVEVNFSVGDSVRVADGYLEGFIGVVAEIDLQNTVGRVSRSMMGKDVAVELELVQLEYQGENFLEGAGVNPAIWAGVSRLVGGPAGSAARNEPLILEVLFNGSKGSWLYQTTDPGRQGTACSAGRPCAGSAWRQHHGIHQGIQRAYEKRRRPHHPGCHHCVCRPFLQLYHQNAPCGCFD